MKNSFGRFLAILLCMTLVFGSVGTHALADNRVPEKDEAIQEQAGPAQLAADDKTAPVAPPADAAKPEPTPGPADAAMPEPTPGPAYVTQSEPMPDSADKAKPESTPNPVRNESVSAKSPEGESRYTVEFTLGQREYVMQGDSEVPLSDILSFLQMAGEVTEVKVSDASLFSVSDETGEWIVTAHRAFSTTEWMKVTIDGVTHRITVTDDQTITVYFLDELNWGTPYIYYWNDGPKYPGLAMTADGTLNGYNCYKATIPYGTDGFFFVGQGFTQTADITSGIEDGATWYAINESDDSGCFKVALYSDSGSGGNDGTITVYLLEDVPEGDVSYYSISFSADNGSSWTNNIQMESAGTGSDSLPRYKAVIPANTSNISFFAVTDYDAMYAGSFTSGIVDGATWKMTYNQDNYSYVASAFSAPAPRPTPVLECDPAEGGSIIEIKPAPIPTQAPSGFDPAHAFQVDANDGWEVDDVVCRFDQDAEQSLYYDNNVLWYIDKASIPQNGYESLTVTAKFVQVYTITAPEGITARYADGSSTSYFKPGKSISLEFDAANVPAGYAIDKLIVIPEGGDATEVSMTRYDNTDYYRGTFTMPAAPVTVAYKLADYTIDTGGMTGGTVTASVNGNLATSARCNDTVTLMAIPNDGYVLRSLTYTPAGGTATELTTTLYDDKYLGSFTMPAAVVTVEAVFVESIGNSALNINLNGERVYDDETLGFVYTGEAVEPAVTVTRWVDGEEVALIQGTDYTVSYTDNTGLPDEVTNAAVILTGKGEYGGTKTIPFRISPFALKDCKVTMPGQTLDDYDYIFYKFEAANYGYAIIGETIMYGNTKLTLGKDYSFDNVVYADDEHEEYDMPHEVGDQCCVIIRGKGDYIGTLEAEFMIVPTTTGGTWGNLAWSFDKGKLSITGTGAMNAAATFQGYPWYENAAYISAIVIGEGITSVPYMAFGGNSSVNPYTNVKKVTLPASMKTIGESSFAYMTSLTSIDLKNVPDIGITAFNQCVRLEVNVPATVTSIGGGAFDACKCVAYAVTVSNIENGTVSADVNYAEAGDTVTLTAKPDEGCELRTLTVTTVNGEPVTVENGAFTMPAGSVIVSATFFTPWQTLQNALNAGGTVTLDKNYTALASDSALEVPAGVTVTLDLNGHTIDRGLAGSQEVYDRVLIVKGNLTVTDSGTSGTITGGNDSGVYIHETGALTLSGGSITGNHADPGGGVRNDGTLTLNGGAISGNTATMGGGVYNGSTGTLTLNSGAVISGNTSGDTGGVYNSGTIIMNGGVISGNTSTVRDSCGGGVNIEHGTMTMNGGAISGNTAGNGGGVCVQYAGTFEMTGGEISGNTATYNYGGGVFLKNSFTLSGGSISGNMSNNLGGGVFLWSGTLNLSGSPTVTGNVHGGTITNGTLSGGTADNLFIVESHITATGALTSDTPIGVSLWKQNYGTGTYDCIPGVFTSGLTGKGDVSNFTSDSEDYAVRLDEAGEAKLTPWHGIAVSAEHGTVTATVNENTVTQAAEGDTVTLNLTPAEGYTIGKVTYNDGSDHTIAPDDGVYSFTMPDSDVTVTAVFCPPFGTPDFVMPTALTTIEESAFEGMTKMKVVDASNVTTIGKNAFKDCTGLTQIRLPKACDIASDAFSGCGKVYVFAPKGGSTQAYCDQETNPCVFVEIEETDVPLSSITGQGNTYQFPSGTTFPSLPGFN